MSKERISEHFSDLYEGKLDEALAMQLQRRMESDPTLKAEYERFKSTYTLLGFMKEDTVEVPSRLSSIIADRLEAEAPKANSFAFNSWFRNLAFGALGVVAIASAIFAIKGGQSDSSVQAGMTQLPAGVTRPVLDTIEVKMVQKEPTLMYTSSGPKTVTVLAEDKKTLIQKYELDKNSLKSPLKNEEAAPAVFIVEATGDKVQHIFVLPGSDVNFEAKGEGTIVDFAKVLSVKFKKVIHIHQDQLKKPEALKWDITATDLQSAAATVLPATEYSLSTSTDGICTISSHRSN